MSYFKAKMHQIRFRLGLRPRARWGSSQRSPDLLAGFKPLRGPNSKGKGARKRTKKNGKNRREGEEEGETGGKGRGERIRILQPPL